MVVGVLLMVLLLPGFDVSYGMWGRYEGVDRGGLLMLHDMAVLNASSTAAGGGGSSSEARSAFAVALQVSSRSRSSV